MNGLSDYSSLDWSRSNDPANTDLRSSSPIGALIHTTSGTNSLSWLIGGAAASGNPASSNFLIDRNGTQNRLCPSNRYPYHAGKAALSYNNKLYSGDAISELLIGIELECLDNQNCTLYQVDSCADVVVKEGLHWGWQWPYYLLGHYEIARPLGRRSDPQGFPWGDFMGRLYARALANKVPGL
jgi:N-acetylmuramoyl-L-alanine amidase